MYLSEGEVPVARFIPVLQPPVAMRLLHAALFLALATLFATAAPPYPSFISSLSKVHKLSTYEWDIRTTRQTNKLTTDTKPVLRSTDLSISFRQSGLNFELCQENSNCAGGRICATLDGNFTSTTGSPPPCPSTGGSLTDPCVCVPVNPEDAVCVLQSDCEEGEKCIDVPGVGLKFCVSDKVDEFFTNDTDSTTEPGRNFDRCQEDSNCAGERSCVTIVGDPTSTAASFARCPSAGASLSDVCLCLPANLGGIVCVAQGDCDEGEKCIEFPGSEFNACVSDTVAGIFPDAGNNDGDGLTGEKCDTSEDCKSPRQCDVRGTSGSTKACFPQTLERCTEDKDCNDGEVCKTAPNLASDPFCASQDADLSSTEEKVTPNPPDAPSASPPSSPKRGGLTFDRCRAASDCKGSRKCTNLSGGGPCNGGNNCRCIQIIRCDNSLDCPQGESCFSTEELSFSININGNICLSTSTEEPICIGADSLKHLSRDQLVFEQDGFARVLCDVNGSCATPGHIVSYRGRALMMQSFCELTGCVQRVLRVNSPKYSRGLTVPSKTEDLVYTVFAARFATRAEEEVLSVAVRLGF